MREVIGFVEDFVAAVAAARTKGGHGTLIIIDEAGKALEHAAFATDGDVQLLQELAELANRSEGRVGLVVLLHQSFDRYATRLGTAQRSEWAKVQGRFEDIAFQEMSDQVLRLISAALSRQSLPRDLAELAAETAQQTARLVRLPGAQAVNDLPQALEAVYPLHPVTALLLGPLFRGRLAQNGPFLFAFLASGEPNGYLELIKSSKASTTVRSFTPDRLYDYVVSSLGGRLFGADSRVWAQIEAAIRRLPEDATEVDVRLVKVIGLLGFVGDSCGLVASRAVLEAVIEAGDSASASRMVGEALGRLQAASLLVFRRYRNAFQLWEGSDNDVDALVRTARQELDGTSTVAHRLNWLRSPARLWHAVIFLRLEPSATSTYSWPTRTFLALSSKQGNPTGGWSSFCPKPLRALKPSEER